MVITPADTSLTMKTGTESCPLIARLDAPGPLMVRMVLIVSGVSRLIVAGSGREKLIVSAAAALSIAYRREPGPPSSVFVTVIVAPKTGKALRSINIASPEKKPFNALADGTE